ncbi:DUF421 domain-containing protein [Sporosarcina pasteurii]|uniref:Protein of uncharacterized function (DUF421) n=1 Tax=Sporosarcina pasteurii TaxID=1474 RepID=A0A380BRP8_SPOPA|nr:DUF421 domain-containing protein [Sporosarcina pasteurii]MDS9471174.1 DUF421 domain-containing protein [Sporosarcina pasteurii]QBQ05187.1 DUF421 domain-containing protein [Sporosarcina pasteurii]SUJ05414.1 Protein of uncharacterised function (DUF421) [Sporosarcina pasteurii]
MPEFLLILIRSIGAFLILLLMARIMGKKQLSQLTFFDYCVGITIGSIAATMSVDQNVKISNGFVSLIIWGLFPLVLAYLGMKNRKFLHLTDGRPAIIIKNGQVLEESMKKNQLAIDELMMLLREKSVFKVDDVEMAILETNGELSILLKTEQQPVTPKLLRLKVEPEKAPTLLIADGTVLEQNLAMLGYSSKWLLSEIKKQGASQIKDVFLAQVDSNGNLYVDLYNDNMVQPQAEQQPSLAAQLKQLQADLEKFAPKTGGKQTKQVNNEQAKKLQKTIEDIIPYLK